jgi:hypothetical protein
MSPTRITRVALAASCLMALAATPASAASGRVEAFSAFDDGSQIQYRVVLCAPVGARVTFTPQLSGPGGRTYISPDQVGQQKDACPTWRFSEPDRYAKGRYSARVRVQVGADVVYSPRRRLAVD